MIDRTPQQRGVVPDGSALAEADRLTAQALRAALAARGTADPLVQVRVGGLPVADLPSGEVVDRLVALHATGRPAIAFALHVGGLISRRDKAYAASMQSADLVYADGVSVVKLARLAGATRIERAATTDIGIELLQRLSATGTTPRVALLGGPPGLAERAGAGLVERFGVDVVHVTHGYHHDWQPQLDALREADPDLLLVGLGAPREMVWVQRHRDALPGLVLTCGGWFGFLAGEEHRAPQLVQRLGCEWVWRWAQQPRRLARRYLLGALVCLRLALGLRLRAAVRRARGRTRPRADRTPLT